ncbi:MAG TPA: low affinity iron permease family protein [Candidatus Dormibacteraeota bacterium]|jgi:low affinity Fe/Cu permease|nr:low affinity iron permease family protein [Candidatus Dormibacteraeota bacterium]
MAPANPTHTAGFQNFATRASQIVGSKWAFALAALIIVLWCVTGPYFHYSDTWQLVVNTATTIITFLMVFLIQNTQNRDARAIHLKLDEIIHSISHARNEMMHIESLSDAELETLSKRFETIRAECELRKGRSKGQPTS